MGWERGWGLREAWDGYIHTRLRLIQVAVQQKPSQRCKGIFLELNTKFKNKINIWNKIFPLKKRNINKVGLKEEQGLGRSSTPHQPPCTFIKTRSIHVTEIYNKRWCDYQSSSLSTVHENTFPKAAVNVGAGGDFLHQEQERDHNVPEQNSLCHQPLPEETSRKQSGRWEIPLSKMQAKRRLPSLTQLWNSQGRRIFFFPLPFLFKKNTQPRANLILLLPQGRGSWVTWCLKLPAHSRAWKINTSLWSYPKCWDL